MQPIYFLRLSNRLTINVASIDYITAVGDSIQLIFRGGVSLSLSTEEGKEFGEFMRRMQGLSQRTELDELKSVVRARAEF